MNELSAFVTSSLSAMALLAGVASTFFLVKGGLEFITSAGSPDSLEHAKKTIRNALVGLVLVLAATTISTILKSTYVDTTSPEILTELPKLSPVEEPELNLGTIITKAIDGFLTNIVESAVRPITDGILNFLQTTPSIVSNSAIFKFWLFILAITNSLFALVIGLIGFQFMSASSFGFEELELKKILPRLGLGFLGANTSIFLIDWIVKLNNTLVSIVLNEYSNPSKILTELIPSGAAVLFMNIIMLVFVILALILLIFYVTRLITLALGAVLSPLYFLLWTFPKFADLTSISAKAYLVTIFSTFVHAVILQLGASFLVMGGDPFISRLVAIGLVLVMIKSLPTMLQMMFYNSGKSLIKNTGGQLINVINGFNTKSSHTTSRRTAARKIRKVK